MSGIYGIVKPYGALVTPEELGLLGDPMTHMAPNGNNSVTQGSVGLGQLKLASAPEATFESLPTQSPCGKLYYTAGARLDNRYDLLRTLNVPSTEHPVTPDSTLVLLAYKRWGKECVQHILGDWSFAIWDMASRTFFAARDHYGQTGFFYTLVGDTLYFSSFLKGLLNVPSIKKEPDPMMVAMVATTWTGQGERCPYKGIYRLPPAHRMVLDPQTGKMSIDRYWKLEDSPDVRFKSDGEYQEALYHHLKQAVDSRMRSQNPYGISLSSGLDSGSVAAFASVKLKKSQQMLHSYTYTPLHEIPSQPGNPIFNESATAREVCDFLGNVTPNFVRSEDVSPCDGVEKILDVLQFPTIGAGNIHWGLSILKKAKEDGIRTILKGQRGNGTISWTGRERILQLMKTGDSKTLLKELKLWNKNNNLPWYSAWKSFVAGPITYKLLNQFSKQDWFGVNFRVLSKKLEKRSFLNPAFTTDLNLEQHIRDSAYSVFPSLSSRPRESRLNLIKPATKDSSPFPHATSATFGIEILDPTADKRVIEYCVGLPPEQSFRDGVDRRLIRKTISGQLPAKVVWGTRRSVQYADLSMRLYYEKERIINTVNEFEQSNTACYYLDVPKMKQWAQNISPPGNNNWINHSLQSLLFMRNLGVGIFLKRF